MRRRIASDQEAGNEDAAGASEASASARGGASMTAAAEILRVRYGRFFVARAARPPACRDARASLLCKRPSCNAITGDKQELLTSFGPRCQPSGAATTLFTEKIISTGYSSRLRTHLRAIYAL